MRSLVSSTTQGLLINKAIYVFLRIDAIYFINLISAEIIISHIAYITSGRIHSTTYPSMNRFRFTWYNPIDTKGLWRKELSFRFCAVTIYGHDYTDGVEQDCSNSSALAIEFLQSCTKPSLNIRHTKGDGLTKSVRSPNEQCNLVRNEWFWCFPGNEKSYIHSGILYMPSIPVMHRHLFLSSTQKLVCVCVWFFFIKLKLKYIDFHYKLSRINHPCHSMRPLCLISKQRIALIRVIVTPKSF